MATSLISWGFALIFCGLLAREVVRNVRAIDYRAIGAAAYLGNCSVWALGLSSSAGFADGDAFIDSSGAAQNQRNDPSEPDDLHLAEPGHRGNSHHRIDHGSVLPAPKALQRRRNRSASPKGSGWTPEPRRTPAEWLEYAPVLSIVIGARWVCLHRTGHRRARSSAALDLNTYNFLFLMAGLLLHWRPRSFSRAVNNAVPATAGVLIQFPFYGGIFGIVTDVAHFTGIGALLRSSVFPRHVSASGRGIFGDSRAVRSSGGSKWIIEAPYVLQAAKDLRVHLGWVVQIYNAAEALPNLINPFWMLPLIGILKVKARDLVGYGLLYLLVNTALVFFLVWFFARTLPYVPPVFPQ